MGLDFPKLAQQGRSYDGARAWESEELDSLLVLERERGLSRTVAADFIRNGITTLEAYDKAAKKKFVPMTQVEAAEAAEEALKDNAFAVEPEKVKPEPKAKEEEVVEEETEVDSETVADPEAEVVEDDAEDDDEEDKK